MAQRMIYESALLYPINDLRKSVDRFVLVLVGQPRGTSLETWKSWVPNVFKETLYPSPENDTIYNGVEINGENWQKGCQEEHRPIIDVVLVLSEHDAPDRYMTGEDPRLAGLDATPYMTEQHPEGLAWIRETYDRLKFPVNKTKWETEQRENWDWADSINFVYFDDEPLMAECEKIHGYRHWHTSWQNQFLHFNEAVEQLPELFNKCTENSVVIRQRYDASIPIDYSLWTYAAELFSLQWSGVDNKPNHITHHGGFNLSPLVSCHDLRIINGHINASDESHSFDGPGARLFGKTFREWLFVDSKRLLGGSAIPDVRNWAIPEMVIPKFCQDNGFTFNASSKEPPKLMSLLDPPIADQWRYYWYDDWTPELVEELRKIAT